MLQQALVLEATQVKKLADLLLPVICHSSRLTPMAEGCQGVTQSSTAVPPSGGKTSVP